MNDTFLYDVIGVSPDATDDEIRNAYKRKAQQLHPDKHDNDPDAERLFKRLQEAYSILGDQDRRAVYDQTGTTEKPPNVDDMAAKQLAEGFAQMMDKLGDESKDIVQLMCEHVHTIIKQGKKCQFELIEKQNLLRVAENRITHTGDSTNVFQIALESLMDRLQADVIAIKKDIEIKNRMIEMLAEYQCKTEERKTQETQWRGIGGIADFTNI